MRPKTWTRKDHHAFEGAKRVVLRMFPGTTPIGIQGLLIRAYLAGRKNGRARGIREGVERARFREPAVLDYP